MIISVTERQTYKRCRRQWMINSRNRWGLQRIVSNQALALGTLVHSALGDWLEAYKNGETWTQGKLAEHFMEHASAAIIDAKEAYKKQVGANMNESELAPLYDISRQGMIMMVNYQERWQQPVPAGFEVVATEQRCVVPIPGTEHTEEWEWTGEVAPDGSLVMGRGRLVKRVYDESVWHYLEGRLDGIIRETRSGKLYVLEHKTYKNRPKESTLHTTDQFTAYHWMLLQLVADMGLDPALVAGVAYDGLWKRAAPPKIVDGHAGELKDLFARIRIEKGAQELGEFEEQLAQEALEMASGPAMFKNRTSDGSCDWMCSDGDLCLAMTRGEDVEWRLRREYTPKPQDDLEDEKEP